MTAEQGPEGLSALRRCAGDPAAFEREHWSRAPLYRPGADTAAFADLFSIDDVDQLVSSAMLRTPAFRLVKDGKPLPPESYTKSGRVGSRPLSDLADPGRVYAQFDAGATIVLQSLHRYWPPLARFCRDLELALTHPVQVNVYVTPPDSRGLGVHHDGHDVFVLQVYGRKQWDVYDTGDEQGGGPPRIAGELQPGDALYIPRSFPHAARTAEVASIHLTVGVLSLTWRDALRRFVDDALADAAFDAPLPVGFAREPDAMAVGVGDQLAELAGRIDKLDPSAIAREAADRFWANRPPLLEGQMQQLLAVRALDDRMTVRRRAGSVCQVRREGERLRVELGDRRLVLPGRVETALRALAGGDAIAVRDVPELDEQSRRVLVQRLVREGLLEVVG